MERWASFAEQNLKTFQYFSAKLGRYISRNLKWCLLLLTGFCDLLFYRFPWKRFGLTLKSERCVCFRSRTQKLLNICQCYLVDMCIRPQSGAFCYLQVFMMHYFLFFHEHVADLVSGAQLENHFISFKRCWQIYETDLEMGFYKRTPEYIPVVDREKLGVFPVPMVHSAVLVDLRQKVTEQFSYSKPPEDYDGPTDDIIIFAHTVKHAGVRFHVMNSEYFGTVQVPLDESYSLQFEVDQFTHTKLEAMVEGPPLYHSPHISLPVIPADMLGFDQVYVINLRRRPERRERMIATLYELGIKAKFVDAVDGKLLNDTYMDSLGIDMLPGYADPYSHRALTLGEIGCFLSHYFIWVEMMEKGYERILVFEDDVRFEAYFRKKFKYMLKEAQDHVPNWELIYLGRKILQSRQEFLVKGTENLVWPSYSYWTLSYILKRSGTKKLLDQKPLGKMIPVDEFLPIMFDKHPETDWRLQFGPRNLVGLSADPLLVFPTHYTGEPNYISDTEVSSIITTEDIEDEPNMDPLPTIEEMAKCKSPECIHDEL
ncbi:probable inactive glycosyltransferase 25 family member 3 isoform X2 [Haliotis asinina]|uniref:probable inactive glycosyltransferase 25 family member 3 isoform X2 n=1 Tax=Haliotis asinina TaxID=109174 RepID=UPI0035325A24